nr:MAG TPA: hypothetical protein [Caudoviricetes sp.]
MSQPSLYRGAPKEPCGALWRTVGYLKEYQRVQSTDNVT